jgi:hypothetical protein
MSAADGIGQKKSVQGRGDEVNERRRGYRVALHEQLGVGLRSNLSGKVGFSACRARAVRARKRFQAISGGSARSGWIVPHLCRWRCASLEECEKLRMPEKNRGDSQLAATFRVEARPSALLPDARTILIRT